MVVTSKKEINLWFNQEADCVKRTTPATMKDKMLRDVERRRRLALKILAEKGSVTVDDHWLRIE